jgi:hypothetical protein
MPAKMTTPIGLAARRARAGGEHERETPDAVASEVMMIGRSGSSPPRRWLRRRAGPDPATGWRFDNQDAVLADRPTSMTMPIWL